MKLERASAKLYTFVAISFVSFASIHAAMTRTHIISCDIV